LRNVSQKNTVSEYASSTEVEVGVFFESSDGSGFGRYLDLEFIVLTLGSFSVFFELPNKFLRVFVMIGLGHLSRIYKRGIREKFSLCADTGDLVVELMTHKLAWDELATESLSGDGGKCISYDQMRERFADLVETRGCRLNAEELDRLIRFTMASVQDAELSRAKSHGLRQEAKDTLFGRHTDELVEPMHPLSVDTYMKCVSGRNHIVDLNALATMFNSRRKAGFLERVFTPARVRRAIHFDTTKISPLLPGRSAASGTEVDNRKDHANDASSGLHACQADATAGADSLGRSSAESKALLKRLEEQERRLSKLEHAVQSNTTQQQHSWHASWPGTPEEPKAHAASRFVDSSGADVLEVWRHIASIERIIADHVQMLELELLGHCSEKVVTDSIKELQLLEQDALSSRERLREAVQEHENTSIESTILQASAVPVLVPISLQQGPPSEPEAPSSPANSIDQRTVRNQRGSSRQVSQEPERANPKAWGRPSEHMDSVLPGGLR